MAVNEGINITYCLSLRLLYIKHFLTYSYSRFRSENHFKGSFRRFRRKPVLVEIYKKIRFKQNPVILPVNICIGVMTGNEIADTLYIPFGIAQLRKHFLSGSGTLLLLKLTAAFPVFLLCGLYSYVVDKGGGF